MSDPHGPKDGKSERILVVEPDPVVRQVIQADLADMGHEVEAVASATAALRALARSPFDIAFVNVGLPRGGARVVLAAGSLWQPVLRCVVVVPFGDGPKITAALTLNPFACLRVPFSAAELESVTKLAAGHAHPPPTIGTRAPDRDEVAGRRIRATARRRSEGGVAPQGAEAREKA